MDARPINTIAVTSSRSSANAFPHPCPHPPRRRLARAELSNELLRAKPALRTVGGGPLDDDGVELPPFSRHKEVCFLARLQIEMRVFLLRSGHAVFCFLLCESRLNFHRRPSVPPRRGWCGISGPDEHDRPFPPADRRPVRLFRKLATREDRSRKGAKRGCLLI